jgi:hypothetical protein
MLVIQRTTTTKHRQAEARRRNENGAKKRNICCPMSLMTLGVGAHKRLVQFHRLCLSLLPVFIHNIFGRFHLEYASNFGGMLSQHHVLTPQADIKLLNLHIIAFRKSYLLSSWLFR